MDSLAQLHLVSTEPASVQTCLPQKRVSSATSCWWYVPGLFHQTILVLETEVGSRLLEVPGVFMDGRRR